jgi:hypothetical protein
MTKEHYLQMKKEFKIRFTIIIVLGIIASVFYIQILLSHSREVPFSTNSVAALFLQNLLLCLYLVNLNLMEHWIQSLLSILVKFEHLSGLN